MPAAIGTALQCQRRMCLNLSAFWARKPKRGATMNPMNARIVSTLPGCFHIVAFQKTIDRHPWETHYETGTGVSEGTPLSVLSSFTDVMSGLRGGVMARYIALGPRVSRLMRATLPGSVEGSRSAVSPATSS